MKTFLSLALAAVVAQAKECWRVDGYQPYSFGPSGPVEPVLTAIPCDSTPAGWGWLYPDRIIENLSPSSSVGYNVPGFSKVAPPNAPMYLLISNSDPYVQSAQGMHYYVGVMGYFGQYQGKPYLWSRYHTGSYYSQLNTNSPPCAASPAWYTGTTIDATYVSGQGCKVATVNNGVPFVWDNNYYLSKRLTQDCEYGSFDGANCYMGWTPTAITIERNAPWNADKMYLAPFANNQCPTFAGVNTMYDNNNGKCFWGYAPIGTHAWHSGNSMYTTPQMCPWGGGYDGANCFLGRAPAGTSASLQNNNEFFYN